MKQKQVIDLPHIECPVYGIAHKYTLDIAGEKGSKELKYRLYGTFYSYSEPTEITVVGIYVSSESPNKIMFGYIDPKSNQLKVSMANGIREIPKEDKSILSEASEEDYLVGLHHAASLFIRYRNKKTFIVKANKLNRTIRGNAHYRIYDVKNNDGKFEFVVANENKLDARFTVIAESITHGTWHKIPGTLCPVPGVDPDER